MKRKLRRLVLALLLLALGLVWAQDIETGDTLFDQGDYEGAAEA